MDLTSENCRKTFLALRHATKKRILKAEFDEVDNVTIDAFNDICIKAADNDPIAQDYLAYIFKKGLGNVIPVNYEKYMQWQILACANGNQFALEKMSLFLSYALNEILFADDFSHIATRNDLTESNYNYIVGRLICEAMADELNLDPKRLISESISHKEFDAKIMHVFDKARNYSIPKILNYLRN